MSSKADGVVGAVSIAVFGVETVLTPASALQWGNVITGIAPALLIIFLVWRVYKLDKQHEACTVNWQKTQEQLVLAYRAIQSHSVRERLPDEADFVAGNFCLKDHEKEECV